MTILDNDLNDAVIGTFAGLPQNARVTVAGLPMRISYTGGTGNDVVLTPEVLAVPGYEVLTGTYVGNGADNRQITGLGFQPDLVIIKANLGLQAVGRTATMTGDVSKNMSTGENVTNAIQSLDPNGFTVGNSLQANFFFVTYQWVAWKAAPGEMTVGTYTGNGAASQSIAGLGFSPDIVFVISGGAPTSPCTRVAPGLPRTRSRSMAFCPPTTSPRLERTASPSVMTLRVNRAGTTYHYVAWNEIPGKIDVGTYTGNGADNRNITGVGFQPDFVMVQTNSGGPPHGGALDGDGALDRHLALLQRDRQPDQPDSMLQPDGFQVGSAPESNGNGSDLHVRRLGACGADRGPHGRHERPPNGERRRPRVAHRVRGRQPGLPRLPRARQRPRPPQHQSTRRLRLAGVARHRDGRRPHVPAGPTSRLARVPPMSSTWVEEIDLSGARTWHGPIRPEMQPRKTTVPMRLARRGARARSRS